MAEGSQFINGAMPDLSPRSLGTQGTIPRLVMTVEAWGAPYRKKKENNKLTCSQSRTAPLCPGGRCSVTEAPQAHRAGAAPGTFPCWR